MVIDNDLLKDFLDFLEEEELEPTEETIDTYVMGLHWDILDNLDCDYEIMDIECNRIEEETTQQLKEYFKL